ncbi:MAG TPA: SDR family NAD(P)-dependent oxidoreductase, partial [Bacteroidales bacterium]
MKTVLITGCSAGFGKETVMLLANKGYHVIAGIRNVNTSNHAVTQELLKNRNVQILELDLTSVDSIT